MGPKPTKTPRIQKQTSSEYEPSESSSPPTSLRTKRKHPTTSERQGTRKLRIEEPSATPTHKEITPEDAILKDKKHNVVPQKKRKKVNISEAQATSSKGQSGSKAKPSGSKVSAIPQNYVFNPPTMSKPPTHELICCPTPFTDAQRLDFKEKYLSRGFCPTVYVDLAHLKKECNLDLSPWLDQFENLLAIRTAYSPSLVKHFYFNMSMANVVDKKGKLIEDKCITSVRGKPITITANLINSLLSIKDPPPVPTIKYDKEKFFKTLMPNASYEGDLKFSPADMPPIHRILWYIYTRNLVQKGKNFTHFNSSDYMLFASLINHVPFNIGHWVYQEIKRFRFQSSKLATIPFPNLVSLILFTHNIWHLDHFEKPIEPQLFGKSHLNYMKITFQEESGQSRAPSRSRAPSKSRASVSRPVEDQTSPGPSYSQPAPQSSNLNEEIKLIVEKAMQETFGSLQTTLTAHYYELSAKLDSELGKLVKKVTSTHTKIGSLDERMENIEGHFEDLGNRFENMHILYQLLDSKVSTLMKNKDDAGPSGLGFSPKHSPLSSPKNTPIPSPPHHSPPHISPPSPEFTTKPSSSDDTADLFDEHSSDASISPPLSPKIKTPLLLPAPPQTPLLLPSPPITPSLSLTIYSPLPILQALRASLASTPPILPDDKGGEEEKK